jgi:hypothetical protein
MGFVALLPCASDHLRSFLYSRSSEGVRADSVPLEMTSDNCLRRKRLFRRSYSFPGVEPLGCRLFFAINKTCHRGQSCGVDSPYDRVRCARVELVLSCDNNSGLSNAVIVPGENKVVK